MCVGNLFKMPKPPPPQKPMAPPPPLKAPPPPAETPLPQQTTEADAVKIDNRNKKALEVEKVQRGVKEFEAIDPASTPETPPAGVTDPK